MSDDHFEDETLARPNAEPHMSDDGTFEDEATLADDESSFTTPSKDQHFPSIDGYRVTGRLGEGGMGVVWRATQLSTNREVALKLMGAHTFGSDKAQARFQREVELAARLEHPAIARVYESGKQRGVCYYAMELVEGVPLDQFVNAKQSDVRGVMEIMHAVCEGVQHAHLRGVIHRDLKPSNILVTDNAQPHVLDFGLAKTYQDDDVHMTISVTGEVAGTPAYMSPEQALGEHHRIDTRSDVYSLGVILFRLLTGESPHDLSGTRSVVLRRIAEDEPVRPRAADSQIDHDIEAMLLKALSREPEMRYSSAGEFARDIRAWLDGDPISAQTPTLTYFLRKRIRKHRSKVAIAVTAVVLVAVIAVLTQKSATASRVNSLVAAIDADINADDWTGERLKTIDALLDQLSRIEKKRASQLASKVNARFSASIHRAIHEPNLSDDNKQSINDALAIYSTRNPDESKKLKVLFDERLHRWNTLFDLKPAFADLSSVFDSGISVSDDGNALTTSEDRAISHVESSGDVQVRGEFDISQADGIHIGFIINSSGEQGYEFMLSLPAANISGQDFSLDFENLDGKLPDGWAVRESKTVALAKDGNNHFVRLTHDRPKGGVVLEREIPVNPHLFNEVFVEVRIRATINTRGEGNGMRPCIHIRFLSSTGKWTASGHVGVNKTTDWVDCRQLFEVPPNTARVAIAFSLRNVNGVADFDDLRVRFNQRARAFREQVKVPTVQILRNGNLLRQKDVDPGEGRIVKLNASRTGTHLTFQVNQQSPIEFDDTFPISSTKPGVIGLIAPETVRVHRLTAMRQKSPRKPSPLERGDELYGQGQFDDALSHYTAQANAATDPKQKLELRYKQAMCRIALKQTAQATTELQTLAVEEGDRWPLLAACQLWIIHLRDRSLDEADAVFQLLRSRYRLENVVGVVPDDIRKNIIGSYTRHSWGISFFGHDNPTRIRQLENLLVIGDLLGVSELKKWMNRRYLLRAYELTGRKDEAIRYVQSQLRQLRSRPERAQAHLPYFLRVHSRLMLERNEPETALAEVNRFISLFETNKQNTSALLVTRARLYAGIGRFADAKNDFDRVTRQDHQLLAGNKLLHGIILEQLGNKDIALTTWRDAYRQARSRGTAENPFAGMIGFEQIVVIYMLGSLSNELTESESKALMNRTVQLVSYRKFDEGATPIQTLSQGVIKFPQQVILNLWRTDRGREFVRQYVFDQIPRQDLVSRMTVLGGMELVVHTGVGKNRTTPKIEKLIEELMTDIVHEYRQKKIANVQFMQMAISWKGVTNVLGWQGLAPTLSPSIRARMTYLMGHRLMKLGRRNDAIAFWRQALDQAKSDERLRTLAQAQLEAFSVP